MKQPIMASTTIPPGSTVRIAQNGQVDTVFIISIVRFSREGKKEKNKGEKYYRTFIDILFITEIVYRLITNCVRYISFQYPLVYVSSIHGIE